MTYYFPNWHRDPRNGEWFGSGWDEWELVRAARPRFDGHRQPRTPLLGYFDDANPTDAAKQIQLANDYGVDGFIFDYYWYEDGPYLQGALDEGFLPARNFENIQFSLMWANHRLVDIFPHNMPGGPTATVMDGAISRLAFETMATHIVDSYFSKPNYLRVQGRPWFSIYELDGFVKGLGGLTAAADALHWFDHLCKSRGFPGIHIDAVVWGIGVLPGAAPMSDARTVLEKLGVASATSYVWVHHVDEQTYEFPYGDGQKLMDQAFEEYDVFSETLPVPFYPNVTVGWDPSPRTNQTIQFERGEYPWMPIWDLSPAQFRKGLMRAKDYLTEHQPPDPMITINAWNEWSEGSSLLPDLQLGTTYLDQVLSVFGPRSSSDRSR